MAQPVDHHLRFYLELKRCKKKFHTFKVYVPIIGTGYR